MAASEKGCIARDRVNYDQLEVGVVYAVRFQHGMGLEPAMFIGRTWYEFAPGDPRNYRREAWAYPGKDGWWRPTWA